MTYDLLNQYSGEKKLDKPLQKDYNPNMLKLFDLLKELITRQFWGKVEISFENGSIVNIKKTESVKF